MPAFVRRAVVAVLALAMTMSMAGSAFAAPEFRKGILGTRPNPDVVIRGSGWGHGVGMSQYGAYAQSRAGWGYAKILKYYYPGVEVPEGNMPGKIRVGLHNQAQVSEVRALTGPVPWRVCNNGDCDTKIVQPEGKTWRVTLKDSGAFRLSRNGDTKWKGGTDKLLIAAFNPKAEANGTIIRAYHPSHGTRRYKWGRMEYRARSRAAGTMFMVLDIPSVELYLRGLGEMPSSWGANGGMAALRAQVIAARTYAVRAHRGNGGLDSGCFCSLGATPLHQAYAGYDKEDPNVESTARYWVQAVKDTPRRLLTYNGELTGSYYSSSHGGRSERVEDSWAYGGDPIPYLRSVDDPWSLKAPGNPFASWWEGVDNDDFARFVGGGMAKVRRVRIVSRTPGGAPIKLAVTGRDGSGRSISVGRAGYSTPRNYGIVGNDLRNTFEYSAKCYQCYSQSTLLSQQVRRIGLMPFTDDDAGKHEYPSVFAYRAGLMNPTGPATFSPGRRVSRGDAAVYLYRLLRLPEASRDFFDDDNKAWQEPAINALAKAGVIGGYGDGTFHPGRHVTRGQAATWFRKALGLAASSRDYYDDDDKSSHEPHINAMRRKGLMYGCGSRRFCPGRDMTRGTMARLLFRTVEAYR